MPYRPSDPSLPVNVNTEFVIRPPRSAVPGTLTTPRNLAVSGKSSIAAAVNDLTPPATFQPLATDSSTPLATITDPIEPAVTSMFNCEPVPTIDVIGPLPTFTTADPPSGPPADSLARAEPVSPPKKSPVEVTVPTLPAAWMNELIDFALIVPMAAADR